MTEKKQTESPSSTANTESQTPKKKPDTSTDANTGINTDIKSEKSSSADKKSTKTPVNKSSVHSKTAKTPSPKATAKSLSPIAIIAMSLALIAIGGCVYLYWFNVQQQTNFQQQITSANQKQKAAINTQITHTLNQQQASISQAFTKLQQQLSQSTQQHKQALNRITDLEKNISRLSQNKPSDWLLHEAEYLIRIAVRTIWLEQDTRTAMSLLRDANDRLAELNHPQFLSLRQLIHDDVNALALMPTLDTENIILTLTALQKQIDNLTLAMAQVPSATTESEAIELTNDHNDWRENLAKTWKRLLGDFITVTRRTGNVEPLMSPKHQQNLRENLALKLQQARWAAREQKTDIYLTSLTDIHQWLAQYFDMSLASSQEFVQTIKQLKAANVSFAYPNNLSSLDAIRAHIEKRSVTAPKTEVLSAETATDKEVSTDVKNANEVN